MHIYDHVDPNPVLRENPCDGSSGFFRESGPHLDRRMVINRTTNSIKDAST